MTQNFLSLQDVFNRAIEANAALVESEFLAQVRNHSAIGKLHVSGFPCAVTINLSASRLEFFEIMPCVRREIPAVEWTDLSLSLAWGGVALTDVIIARPGELMMTSTRPGDHAIGLWSDLWFKPDEIERVWRKTKRAAKAAAVTACSEWLEKLRQDNPEQPRAKEELQAEASRKFNVGAWQFRKAWSAATIAVPNAGWNRAGARKKS